MCKRSTPDKLVRLFVDTYGMNLLRVPRANLAVADLYLGGDGGARHVGALADVVVPALDALPVTAEEPLADVAGTLSDAVEAKAGLGLVEGFLAAVGVPQLLGTVRARFAAGHDGTMRFRLAHPTRDSVPALVLGKRLIDRSIDLDNALLGPDPALYVATAVLRSASLSLVTDADRARTLEGELKAAQLASGDARLRVRSDAHGELTFEGATPLAFGVELYALRWDAKARRLTLRAVDDALALRGVAPAAGTGPIRPALLGGHDGDAFVALG